MWADTELCSDQLNIAEGMFWDFQTAPAEIAYNMFFNIIFVLILGEHHTFIQHILFLSPLPLPLGPS